MSRPAILGGKPIRQKQFIPRKTMGKAEKDAVLQVMETDVLSAFIAGPGKFFLGGEKVQEFEKT